MIVRGGLDMPLVIGDNTLPATARLQLHRFEGHMEPLDILDIVNVPKGYQGQFFLSALSVNNSGVGGKWLCTHRAAFIHVAFPPPYPLAHTCTQPCGLLDVLAVSTSDASMQSSVFMLTCGRIRLFFNSILMTIHDLMYTFNRYSLHVCVRLVGLNFLEGCYHMYDPADAPFPGVLLSTGTGE